MQRTLKAQSSRSQLVNSQHYIVFSKEHENGQFDSKLRLRLLCPGLDQLDLALRKQLLELFAKQSPKELSARVLRHHVNKLDAREPLELRFLARDPLQRVRVSIESIGHARRY